MIRLDQDNTNALDELRKRDYTRVLIGASAENTITAHLRCAILCS